MQTVCVADTDAKAEQLFAKHAEYFFQKGHRVSIPMERLALPGGIDIKGLEFIFRDPGDFGIYPRCARRASPNWSTPGRSSAAARPRCATRVTEFAREFRIGNLHAMLQFGSMPPELAKDNIDLFAGQVMPELKTIWDDEGWQHHWWPERLGGVPLPATNASRRR